jgi:hypothetical protein
MSEPRPDRCETCRFWDLRIGDSDEGAGVCRRHAPVAATPAVNVSQKVEDQTASFPSWPLTLNDEWCGEWQVKPSQGSQ